MSRTLLNLIRPMLYYKSLLNYCRAKALFAVVYVLFLGTLIFIPLYNTPLQFLIGFIPSNIALASVWNKILVRYVREKSKKLDTESQKVILMGVFSQKRSCKLWDTVTEKIFVSHDVTCDVSLSYL